MEERRRIDRVGYQAKSVIVVCDTGESIFVETRNVSPLGIAFTMPAGSPDLKGKDIIIVADTMIMYADVTRQEEHHCRHCTWENMPMAPETQFPY